MFWNILCILLAFESILSLSSSIKVQKTSRRVLLQLRAASDDGTAINEGIPLREKIENMIKLCSQRELLRVRDIKWKPGRIEVVLVEDSEDELSPSIDAINAVHRSLSEIMEVDSELDAILISNEVVLASPGVGEDLYREIDFTVFKGFPVTVTTTEEHKKKKSFEGSLIERTDKHVVVSQKGRIVKVPREIIDKVSLPKPKFEQNDDEIRKMR